MATRAGAAPRTAPARMTAARSAAVGTRATSTRRHATGRPRRRSSSSSCRWPRVPRNAFGAALDRISALRWHWLLTPRNPASCACHSRYATADDVAPLRYTAQPSYNPTPEALPRCPYCNRTRIFEFQVTCPRWRGPVRSRSRNNYAQRRFFHRTHSSCRPCCRCLTLRRPPRTPRRSSTCNAWPAVHSSLGANLGRLAQGRD